MNKYLCSAFAMALSFTAYSAIAATTPSNTDDASSLGTDKSPQQMDQADTASSKTGQKPMSHKRAMHRRNTNLKAMDTNGDSLISKDEYMAYHEQQYAKMKQSDDGVTYRDMESGANRNSMNNKPIGTTAGKSTNGSTDDTKEGPINGTHTGTN